MPYTKLLVFTMCAIHTMCTVHRALLHYKHLFLIYFGGDVYLNLVNLSNFTE